MRSKCCDATSILDATFDQTYDWQLKVELTFKVPVLFYFDCVMMPMGESIKCLLKQKSLLFRIASRYSFICFSASNYFVFIQIV